MATDRVSGYQPRPVEREPEPRESQSTREMQRARETQNSREPQRARTEPAKPTPEQARADSIAKKPNAAVKTLGSRIDVYA